MFCKLEVQIHPLESQHPDCFEGLEWSGWQKTTRISQSPILDVPGQAFKHRLWWKCSVCTLSFHAYCIHGAAVRFSKQLFLMHFGNCASEMFYKFMGLLFRCRLAWNTITFPWKWSMSLIKPNLMELSGIRLSPKGSVISYIVSFSLWIGIDFFLFFN